MTMCVMLLYLCTFQSNYCDSPQFMICGELLPPFLNLGTPRMALSFGLFPAVSDLGCGD